MDPYQPPTPGGGSRGWTPPPRSCNPGEPACPWPTSTATSASPVPPVLKGARIRSLAEVEAQWTRYLEADEGSPEAFFGQVLVMFAAWVADQKLQSVKRRTKEGLERAREQGKVLGPPRKFRPNQVETMRRMREGGASLRRIAA